MENDTYFMNMCLLETNKLAIVNHDMIVEKHSFSFSGLSNCFNCYKSYKLFKIINCQFSQNSMRLI